MDERLKVVYVGTRDYRLEVGARFGADVIFNVADSESPYYSEVFPGFFLLPTTGECSNGRSN